MVGFRVQDHHGHDAGDDDGYPSTLNPDDDHHHDHDHDHDDYDDDDDDEPCPKP